MAWDETCSKEGGGVLDLSILGTNAFNNQLASEEVVWTLFLSVGVDIGLLGVIVQGISGGENGTKNWTGEQGVAEVVEAVVHPRENIEWLLQHAET
jgi:hypothetical protein